MKKIHHFISKDFILQPGLQHITQTAVVHQVGSILKLVPEERIVLGDGTGKEAEAVIQEVHQRYIRVVIEEIRDNQHELPFPLQLYCSVLKRENFEWVVEKTTELGVVEIIPLSTARTIKSNLNLERLKKIALEAAEQCERGVVPTIREPIQWEKVLQDTLGKRTVFLCDKTGSDQAVVNRIPGELAQEGVSIFIGPEGGWTDDELEQAKQHGMSVVTLGNTMLRAETAAVVGCFWVSRMVQY